jgi:hypothetical protein
MRLPGHSHAMQINRKMKALMFGDPVAAIYEACGKRRGILPRAFQANLVVFQNWIKEAAKIFKMKTYKPHVGLNATKQILTGLVLLVGLIVLRPDVMAGPAPVPLGSADGFAVTSLRGPRPPLKTT